LQKFNTTFFETQCKLSYLYAYNNFAALSLTWKKVSCRRLWCFTGKITTTANTTILGTVGTTSCAMLGTVGTSATTANTTILGTVGTTSCAMLGTVGTSATANTTILGTVGTTSCAMLGTVGTSSTDILLGAVLGTDVAQREISY